MALDPKTKETVREEALRLSKEFAALDGRRPRVLLIEMENDLESDREERKLAANALADSGWDVDVSPSQQPEDAAKGQQTMTFTSSSTPRQVTPEAGMLSPSRVLSLFTAVMIS